MTFRKCFVFAVFIVSSLANLANVTIGVIDKNYDKAQFFLMLLVIIVYIMLKEVKTNG
jgi:hypothetical protein